MTTSPFASGLAAPGIRAIACSKVKVRSCSGLSLAGLFFGGIAILKMATAGPYSPAVPDKSSQIVLVPPVTATEMAAAKAEAEAHARPVIGIIRVGIGTIPVIGGGRRRPVIITARRRRRA